jgi:hypothetical protein
MTVPVVHCPDCGAVIELPRGTRPEALVECPNCAGHALRVHEDAGRWSATLAYRVSCLACDDVMTLPEGVKPGDTVRCCRRTYRLTFEYGAFAAEEAKEDTMRFATLSAGLIAWVGAALASLCCLLPLTVIVLGLGSGALMATTMQYRWLLVPAGVIGIVTGFVLCVRERRRCSALACRMAGSHVTLALLIVASVLVSTGSVVALLALCLPAAAIAWVVSGLWERFRESPRRCVIQRALAPLLVGLMFAAGYTIATPHAPDWRLWLIALATATGMLTTRLNALYLLAGGAVLGGILL